MSTAAELAMLCLFATWMAIDVWMTRPMVADWKSFRRRIADLESAVYHLSLQEPAPHARHPIPTYSDN